MIRDASTQGDKANSMMNEVNLAKYHPLSPMIYEMRTSEHTNVSVLVTVADEDDDAVQRADVFKHDLSR